MFQLSNSESCVQLHWRGTETAGGQAESLDIYAIVGLSFLSNFSQDKASVIAYCLGWTGSSSQSPSHERASPMSHMLTITQ